MNEVTRQSQITKTKSQVEGRKSKDKALKNG